MPSFRFLPLARDDLNAMWEYIAQDNLDAAERLVDRIEELCHLFAQQCRGVQYLPLGPRVHDPRFTSKELGHQALIV